MPYGVILKGVTAAWEAPPAALLLASGEAHVWRAELNGFDSELDAFRETLAPEELARAARFVFDRDRRRFITARGVLRDILAGYLNTTARSVSIAYSVHGKPFLPGQSGEAALRFNVSHSRALATFAIARGMEIGVDIEYINPQMEIEEIASQYFADTEVAALRALRPDLRIRTFFDIWTRKEAYIKAAGEGFGIDLQGFHVPIGQNGPIRPMRRGSEEWFVRGLAPGDNFSGALVVPGGPLAGMRCFDFETSGSARGGHAR